MFRLYDQYIPIAFREEVKELIKQVAFIEKSVRELDDMIFIDETNPIVMRYRENEFVSEFLLV